MQGRLEQATLLGIGIVTQEQADITMQRKDLAPLITADRKLLDFENKLKH